jgi:formyl-CoA transferase
MVQPDRYWSDFCDALGLQDIVDQYDAFDKRAGNEELFQTITATFSSKPLSYWRERLGSSRCIWASAQMAGEVPEDVQAIANGYTPDHPTIPRACLVASPVQYKNEMVEIHRAAPGAGEHNEEILLELGFDRPEIARLHAEGVISSS